MGAEATRRPGQRPTLPQLAGDQELLAEGLVEALRRIDAATRALAGADEEIRELRRVQVELLTRLGNLERLDEALDTRLRAAVQGAVA